MDAGLRRRTLSAARRLGVEPQLRRVQDAVAPFEVWRNRRDDAHRKAIMAAALGPDANGIDVGANVGEVLGTLVRLAPRGRHIAYEPLPELAAGLAERLAGRRSRCPCGWRRSTTACPRATCSTS